MYRNCEGCGYFDKGKIKCRLKNKYMADRCSPKYCDKFQLKNELSDIRFRRVLAIANLCRGWLYINGFITDKEVNDIYKKILKFKDRFDIEISVDQLDSAGFTYDDNAKHK